MRRKWPLRRAALKRQNPDVGVSADFDNGEQYKPFGPKKHLIKGTARHRLGRREIKFARDATAHEHGKGSIPLVFVRPLPPDICVHRRQHRLAGRDAWRATTNRKKERAETVRRL